MTILTTESAVAYEGQIGQADFPYNFRVDKEEDMNVILGSVLTTEWTMTGIGEDAGGIVTLNVPLEVAILVSLIREVDPTQEVDYQAFDAFPAETHEKALDKLTMLSQQIQQSVGAGTLRIPANELALGLNVTTPPVAARKDMVLAFDEFGNVTVVAGPGGVTATYVAVAGPGNPNGFVDSQEMLAVDNLTGGARLPLISVRTPNQGNALLQLAGGAIPQAVVDASAIVQNIIPQVLVDGGGTGIDIELLTASYAAGTETIGVNNPNLAGYLLQLDEFGQVPSESIRFAGLRNRGSFRGDDLCDKAGDDPGDCTAPDYRNPSQRFLSLDPVGVPDPVPSAMFTGGDFFAISMLEGEIAGSMNLFLNIGDAAMALIPVEANDGVTYIREVLDPDDGVTILVHEGWYHQPDRFNLTTANLVALVPLPHFITGDNVQTGMQHADTQLEANRVAAAAAQTTANAAQGDIDAHLAEVDNPHSVTAAQAGAEAANANIQTHVTNTAGNPHNTTAAHVGAPAGSWTWDSGSGTLAITVT